MRFGSPPPRHRRHLAVFLAIAGVASIVGSVAVGALEGEPFRVAEGEPGGGTYGPIVGSDPAGPFLFGGFPPDECALMASCVTIPFEVVVPDRIKETDDFFVDVVVSWHDPEHASDIDIYVWDDGQQAIEEAEAEGEEPPAEKTYTVQTDSASSANPEIARLFKPTYGNYHLTIINFLGPPITVDVAAKMVAARYSTPFELLAPEAEATSPTPPARERAAITPEPAPAPSVARPAPSGAATPTSTPSLPTIELASDDAFDDFGDAGFEDALVPEVTAEDEVALAELAEEMAASRSQEPSGAALFLSLVAAPLLFVSAAGAWFWRRSPAAMHFA